ncbi:MAG: hypothetical protein OXM55_05760 [Bdellovibrionales bacterium]|nr:hypothetical protein [Bdellovibrionales bacterium]
MKWFLVVLSLFCFSSLAQVVCRSPENIGEESSEAGSLSSVCNEAVLAAVGDTSDREVNSQQVVRNIQGGDTSDSSEGSLPAEGDDSGVVK